MTPEEFETAWVPVPLAWRHVVNGDVIVGKGATSWTVWVLHAGGSIGVKLHSGARPPWSGQVDPDETVQVLTPWPMAQAVALTRAELGARLLERRTTTEGAA